MFHVMAWCRTDIIIYVSWNLTEFKVKGERMSTRNSSTEITYSIFFQFSCMIQFILLRNHWNCQSLISGSAELISITDELIWWFYWCERNLHHVFSDNWIYHTPGKIENKHIIFMKTQYHISLRSLQCKFNEFVSKQMHPNLCRYIL